MKKYLPIVLSVFLMSSCASITKQMQRGNYDAVIQKSTKKLIRKPDSKKHAEAMDRAYRLANERDLERIKYLKRENNPNNYDEIFNRYARLKERQRKVRTVTPLTIEGKTYNYEYVDYDAEMVESKRKAAEHFYNHGRELLENANVKEDYRNAHFELTKAAEYSGGQFPNLDQMIYDARMLGISRVLVEPVNLSQINLPPHVMEDMTAFDTRGLDRDAWVEYHFKHVDEDVNYDYAIYVKINSIMVSPDEVKDGDQLFTKKIEDGFDYALDADGNVMKDSAGNDIKIPRYKEISCTLIETQQMKSVTLDGEVEIMSLEPERLMQKEPFGAESKFEHFSARAVGNLDALPPEELAKTKQERAEFPTDVEMVMMTADAVKPAIRDAIYRNRDLIR